MAAAALVKLLGTAGTARAAFDLMKQRLSGSPCGKSLEALAVHAYGRPVASLFLLNYSEKLWGLPAAQLAESAAGSRLKTLHLRSVVAGALGFAKPQHYEGAFLYPRHGIGEISDRLADACGSDRVITRSPITGLRHDGHRITEIGIGGDTWIDAGTVISTLPVDLMLGMLHPAAPDSVRALVARIRYRNLVLVTLAIDRPQITNFATVYFPDAAFPFTRVSEPRNRSAEMAPPGQTSLLVELPCDPDDAIWAADDTLAVTRVVDALSGIGWFSKSQVRDARVFRLSHAYPVAALGVSDTIADIARYLQGFQNLHLLGRNAEFRYTWIHELLAGARTLVDDIARG
jgi:protoporphyrinogen oxidase